VPPNVGTFSDLPKKPSNPRASGAAADRRGGAGSDAAARMSGSTVAESEKPAGSGAAAARSGAASGGRRAAAVDSSFLSPRRTLFLPGSTATWSRLDLELTGPFRLQAGGRIELGPDAAGPDGVRTSGARTAQSATAASELLIPSAPYLSLIARVCSPLECSAPFPVGSRTILCPSVIGVQGQLELWTNNRVREGRSQTRNNFSGATGGFHVYLEPASASLCGKPSADASFLNEDAAELAAGRTLDRPEFVISSSQSAWKPFFLPLDRPLRLRATGEVRPGRTAEATSPDGIQVPDVPRWTYPGTQVVVDADHPLFDGLMPYQALIGRVCGASGCGPTFFVGRDRIVCAGPAYRDRLELWINHIIPPRSLLAQTTPLTLEAFDLQARTGAYRFTVAPAPAGSCPGG
jgi:hypothetical protein